MTQMVLFFFGGMAFGVLIRTPLARIWRWAKEVKLPPAVLNERGETVRSRWIERVADNLERNVDKLERENAVQDKIRRMEADRDARVEAFRASIPPK